MRKSDFTLPTLDDLFSTQAERDDAKLERVRNIPLAELHPFKGHPFKVQNNEEMQRMIESIRKVGAITPALARPRSTSAAAAAFSASVRCCSAARTSPAATSTPKRPRSRRATPRSTAFMTTGSPSARATSSPTPDCAGISARGMISCWQTSCPTSSSRWPRTPRHFSPQAARSSARASSTGARMRCAPPSRARASRSRRTTALRSGTASRPRWRDGAAGSLTTHEATFLCTLTGAARRFGKRELR